MAENLNISTRIDGSQNQTDNSSIEKYCYSDNDANCTTYGGLYQWDEMMQYVTTEGVQGICPSGWYIPTDTDWTILPDYIGGVGVAGGKMKETGTAHWNSPNTGATNSSGFTALPGGCRHTGGYFVSLGFTGFWWTATEDSSTTAYGLSLYYDYEYVYHDHYSKDYGFSVRCLRD